MSQWSMHMRWPASLRHGPPLYIRCSWSVQRTCSLLDSRTGCLKTGSHHLRCTTNGSVVDPDQHPRITARMIHPCRLASCMMHSTSCDPSSISIDMKGVLGPTDVTVWKDYGLIS
uniref:Uncharacterized protein n=1 Tax=Dali Parti tick virus 1 TaxID=2972282 RepID=A0A9E8A9J9_9VIRU|nr:MAG: hypothetical protein [Dali Parti tick virus 1]